MLAGRISRPKYLSVGCYEILRYKKLYPNESKFFLAYHHINSNREKLEEHVDLTKSYKQLTKMVNTIEKLNEKN